MTDDRFPALTRLTDEIGAAMHAAEQHPARRRRRMPRTTLLALAALTVSVPTAVAVHLATRTRIELPTPDRDPQAAFVVGKGEENGLFWTLAVTRCALRGVVTLVPATLIERTPGDGGVGYSQCPRGLSGNPPRRQPLLVPTFGSAPPRLSVHWGIVPARVASVELRIGGRRVAVRTQALDPAGVRAGNLPLGYRLFVVLGRGSAIYTRAVARSADGRVLRDCTRRQCDSLGRRGR